VSAFVLDKSLEAAAETLADRREFRRARAIPITSCSS
jgi:hypothetical protein